MGCRPSCSASFQLFRRSRRKRLHLPDRNRVEAFEPLSLRQFHVDELCVHVLQVGGDEELSEGRVVAHVAVLAGVGVAPFACGLTEEGDVEEVGFVGVGDGRLFRGDLGRDEVCLDGVGVEAVVDLGQSAIEIPSERETSVFILLEPLEFLDEVNLELRADPHPKLEGDVVVGVSAAVTPSRRPQSDGVGFLHPFLDTELVAVQPGLTFNYGEFAGIKIRVVDGFPDTEKFDGIAVAQPVGDEELTVLGFEHIGERDEILVLVANHGNLGALDVDRGVGGFFLHARSPFLIFSQASDIVNFRITEFSVRRRLMYSVDWLFISRVA